MRSCGLAHQLYLFTHLFDTRCSSTMLHFKAKVNKEEQTTLGEDFRFQERMISYFCLQKLNLPDPWKRSTKKS